MLILLFKTCMLVMFILMLNIFYSILHSRLTKRKTTITTLPFKI